jgi:hypothetical protein
MGNVLFFELVAFPEAEFLDVIGEKIVFLLAIHQSPLLTDFTPLPPPPLEQKWLKLVCNVNIVYRKLQV